MEGVGVTTTSVQDCISKSGAMESIWCNGSIFSMLNLRPNGNERLLLLKNSTIMCYIGTYHSWYIQRLETFVVISSSLEWFIQTYVSRSSDLDLTVFVLHLIKAKNQRCISLK